MTEQGEYNSQPTTPEQHPTYDSFGDPDEALAWVLERLNITYKPDGVRQWWTHEHARLGGKSPEQVWNEDPDSIIRLAVQIEG